MFKKLKLTAVELFLCPSCEDWPVGEEEKAGQKNRSAAQRYSSNGSGSGAV